MKNRLLILGGGFGLYGYLPAAINNDWEITTLDRYKDFISRRAELKEFLYLLKFESEGNLDFSQFKGVVIARTPLQQSKILLGSSNYQGHYFLEKPLGINAASHADILRILEDYKLNFSVAYLFRYQDWYRSIVSAANSDLSVSINWRTSRNMSYSWKEAESLGGGVLSYFGIHFLSLLVDLGINLESLDFEYNTESLVIRAINHHRQINMKIDYSDDPSFKVKIHSQSKDLSWDLISPFGLRATPGVVDPRIPPLTKYLATLGKHLSFEAPITHEFKVLELRKKIENACKI